MTECERIINGGILPECFFAEELLCDYRVTQERKKIWAISLDLLFKFDEVCRKHHLNYTLAYGSLLGAIRHEGFIPWDDDIDVFMPRKDYEQLKSLEGEFKYPYFLQIPGQNGYYFSFAKLRNSNTTSLSHAFRYESFNQGIALDIFILDNYDSRTIDEDLKRVKLLVAECSALMRRSCPHPSEKDLGLLKRFPVIRDGAEIIDEMESILRRHENSITDEYVCLCNLIYDYKRGLFLKKDIDSVQDVLFYGHSVLIPRNYITVLHIIYGNYMKLPPIEERGQWHADALFDPDRPYTEYVKELWDKEKA